MGGWGVGWGVERERERGIQKIYFYSAIAPREGVHVDDHFTVRTIIFHMNKKTNKLMAVCLN